MIVESISKISSPPLFFKLFDFISHSELFIKLEGLNIAGSIKLTTALGLIESLEEQGKITSKTKLVEASSGNLGLALSIICKEKGYPFICVTDLNILPENEKLIRLYGASVVKVTKKDANGGYIASRIEYIQKLIQDDGEHIWINQHANRANPSAHYSRTGVDILCEFPDLDYLFIGAGTTGTLMGCAALFKEKSPRTKIIAVDSEGSVTFGFPPKKIYIPGVGVSKRPEIVDESLLDQVVLVDERDTVIMCRFLLKNYGLCLGGSSGTVLHGIRKCQNQIPAGSKIMAISPDFGHKYLNTIYDDQWVHETFSISAIDLGSIGSVLL